MNLQNVCRTCLRVPNKPKDLFKEERYLLKKIETISNVVIVEDSELSQQICGECIEQINSFYNFRKVIINTDLDLRRRLDTLKKTNYVSKPPTRLKKPDKEDNDLSQFTLDLKTENYLSSPDHIGYIEPDDYAAEDDLTILKAIAMRKLYKCKQCKEIFESRFKLFNHKRTVHTMRGVCNICGMVMRADNLSKHIKLHSEEPVKCEICDKIFKNSESLRSHKLLHLGNSYTCEICGRSFRMKSEHTRHLKQHKDPNFRKVACKLCGKKVHEMKKHMLTHTGERPFSCKFCNKGFCSRYAVKVHQRQHTNEKPYICDYCGYAFPQKVSLVTHLKSKHRIEEVQKSSDIVHNS